MISPIDFILKHNTVALTKRYVQETLMGNNTNRQGPHDGVRPPLTCVECNGTGRTDNHVTGEVECSGCEGTGVEERMEPSNRVDEAERRIHDQNLEILRLEGELQAAQAAANGLREDRRIAMAQTVKKSQQLAASQREVERLKQSHNDNLLCHLEVEAKTKADRDRLQAENAELTQANIEVNAACMKEAVKVDELQTALDEATRLLKAVRWIGAPVAYVENLRNEVDAFLAAQPQPKEKP